MNNTVRNKIKYIYKRIVPKKARDIIGYFKSGDFIREIQNRQRKTSYGTENPDKIFYIIGFNRSHDGLLYILTTTMLHIEYAIERNYIPVVDLQNYANQYLDKKVHGGIGGNAWEYYFRQPMGYDLKDIGRSKNIVLSRKDVSTYNKKSNKSWGTGLLEDKPHLMQFCDIFRNYIKFSPEAEQYINHDYENILTGDKKVLGVLCRGTDYLVKKPRGHQIQPEPMDVLKKAREVMAEYNCTHLYLATEDQDIYELFKQTFNDKLLANRQKRFKREEVENVQWLSEIDSDRESDKYLLGLEYLSSLYLLAHCSCFIGGSIGGTVGVYLMTDGFEYEYVWNLGRYT